MSALRRAARIGAALCIPALLVAALTVLGAAGPGDPLPADYWTLPVPLQGEAPAAWSDDERSLQPEACGQCHQDHYAEWQGTLHAQAFSPGLLGQLLTFDREAIAGCLECHAPLTEQRQAFLAELRGEPAEPAQVQAEAGNGCASCHVRAHRRYGPPPAADNRSSTDARPHGGALYSADFDRSEFCRGCHQFSAAMAVNGKPLENTLAEWLASPYPQRGQTCQSCHMPERRHLWRGIHDPATVAGGLETIIAATADQLRFTLRNSGVGHAFPTYATPKVVMHAVALDDRGVAVEASAVEHAIQRLVEYTPQGWIELSDTRLSPDDEASVTLPWGDYAAARVWVEVLPDEFYHRHVFPQLLSGLAASSAAAQNLAIADTRAGGSAYVLFDTIAARPH